jgi:DNA-binding GntR family transcriptional regulator
MAALEAGDPEGAAEAMAVHLDYVLRYSTEYPKNRTT